MHKKSLNLFEVTGSTQIKDLNNFLLVAVTLHDKNTNYFLIKLVVNIKPFRNFVS